MRFHHRSFKIYAKYRLKFQLAMNDVYFLQNGGGSGLDYVILMSEGGWVSITVDYGGG